MTFFYLLKSTFREICCRKKLFCWITTILIISFLIIDYSLIIFGSVFARGRVTDRIVNGNSELIYFLNLDKYKMMTGDISDRLLELLNDIGKIEGVEIYGTYWDNSEFFIDGNEYPVVSVSETLLHLCDLEEVSADMLVQQEDTGYIGVIAGYELGKQYPVGTVVTDDNTEGTYIVTHVLPKRSRWIDTDIKNGLYIDFDRQFLMGTQSWLKENTIFIGNGLNNFCYQISPEADEEEIKSQIELYAQQLNVDIYSIRSLKENIEYGWTELREGREELYLSVFLMFSAVLAMLTASMITIYVRKKDIGVLYANGYSKSNIMYMYIIENGLKVVIAFVVALTYWSIQQYTVFERKISIMWILTPWSAVIAVLLVILGSIVPLLQIRGLQPAELVGKDML